MEHKKPRIRNTSQILKFHCSNSDVMCFLYVVKLRLLPKSLRFLISILRVSNLNSTDLSDYPVESQRRDGLLLLLSQREELIIFSDDYGCICLALMVQNVVSELTLKFPVVISIPMSGGRLRKKSGNSKISCSHFFEIFSNLILILDFEKSFYNKTRYFSSEQHQSRYIFL